MKIVIKTKNIQLTTSLKEYIREKINSLEKFAQDLFGEKYFNHLPKRSAGLRRTSILRPFGKGKPRVEAWVEVGKETLHHKKGPFFWAECQMRFPKQSIRSTARAENLKLAIGEVKDKLQREFKEYKEKLKAQTERGTRILKKELKLAKEARFYRKGRIRKEGI